MVCLPFPNGWFMALFFPHFSPCLLAKSFIFSRNLSYLHGHGWILFWCFFFLSLSLSLSLSIAFSRNSAELKVYPHYFSCVSIPQLGRLVVAVVPEGQARREPLAFRPGPESRHVAVCGPLMFHQGQRLGFNQQKWWLKQPKPWIQPAKRTQHRDLTTT